MYLVNLEKAYIHKQRGWGVPGRVLQEYVVEGLLPSQGTTVPALSAWCQWVMDSPKVTLRYGEYPIWNVRIVCLPFAGHVVLLPTPVCDLQHAFTFLSYLQVIGNWSSRLTMMFGAGICPLWEGKVFDLPFNQCSIIGGKWMKSRI